MSAILKLREKIKNGGGGLDVYAEKKGIASKQGMPRNSSSSSSSSFPSKGKEHRKSKKKAKKHGPIKPVIEEVFPEKTEKKKKAKKVLPDHMYDSDSSDDEEEKPKAWDPPSIMDNLKDPSVVNDISHVIATIKGEEGEGDKDEKKKIVWDHGASKEGEKSDANLHAWLEAFSAHECLRKREQDDLIFDDGAKKRR